MKKYVIFYPWVHLVKDYKGYGVVYDVIHRKIYLFNPDEMKTLEMYVRTHEVVSLESGILNKLLSLRLAFLCDEPLYIDRMRIGSLISDISAFRSSPPLQNLELILNSNCIYYENCPLKEKDIILSFPCRLCYRDCKSNHDVKLRFDEAFLKEAIGIITKLAPTTISISGFEFEKDNHIIESILSTNVVKKIILNIPHYEIIHNTDTIKKLISCFGSDNDYSRVVLNISAFLDQRESFDQFLEIVHSDFLKCSMITLCFDLSNLKDAVSFLVRSLSRNFLNVFPAFYVQNDNFSVAATEMRLELRNLISH